MFWQARPGLRIVLTLPRGASADIHAETDGGSISVNLDDEVDYKYKEDDEVELTVGDGAAQVELGTGSGDIRIRN